jgi:outer membrane protein
MLRIYIDRSPESTTLRLEGKLAGPWVNELEHCWQDVLATPRKSLRVDLHDVTFVAAEGKALLARMHKQGVELIAAGPMTRSIVEEIRACDADPGPSAKVHSPGHGPLFSILLAFSLLLAGGKARAQQKPPLRITLREAVRMALRQNPQVQIALLNVAQSEQDHSVARAALLPQADLSMLDAVQRFNLEAFIGKGLPGSPQHAGPFQLFQAGPGFSVPVFDLTLWRRWQASHQGVNATESERITVREQAVLLVVSQYMGGLRAAANVRAARSRVDLAQALYDQAADLQKHGVGTGLDTLRANVELQNEKQRLIAAETQLKTSLYGLVRLLNLDPRQKVELADELGFFQTPEFQTEQSIEEALETRPEMKALAARERMARLERGAASASRFPTVDVSGNWAYQGLSAPTAIPSYRYQVEVNFPLFTGGRIRAEMIRADLELKKLGQEREDLRNSIALEVKTALAQLESARHEVEVASLGVKLAQEEVSQARDRFSAGVANNIEVIAAQDALARANDNQIGALYGYNQSRADLAHAVGRMESLYAK